MFVVLCPAFAEILRQTLHDAHGLDAEGDDLADEVEDVFGVAAAVGARGDVAALVPHG
ncbi:MAG: hypothetical protein ACLFU6_12755 [Candidatus Hydrogenedentota bacterium]